MYTAIRRIHLFSGLVLLAFVIMYFGTGYLLIHDNWFPRSEGSKKTRTLALGDGGITDGQAFAGYLEDAFGVRGKRGVPKKSKDGSWKITWFRPGTDTTVVIAPDGRQATLTETDLGRTRVFMGLHRLHGYGGGRLYDFWALLMDLSSASMIAFAGSGVYLWYRSTAQRLAGWLCLGAGSALTVATVLRFLWGS